MNQPCKECPYKKDSLPGYLGESSYDPERFLQQLEGQVHPCHLTVDWENNNHDKSQVCIGALQFMNNSCMMSRNKDVVALQKEVGKNENVLSFKHNFIKHHGK